MRMLKVLGGLIWLITLSSCIVAPWDPTNPQLGNKRSYAKLETRCFGWEIKDGILHKITIPCAKHLEIAGMQESQCPGSICNHVLSEHSPSQPKAAGIDVIGFLEDDRNSETLALPPGDNQFYDDCFMPETMGLYQAKYLSGQAAGFITLEDKARTMPGCPPGQKYGRWALRSEYEESCCEEVYLVGYKGFSEPIWECVCRAQVYVGYASLKELPPPPLVTHLNTPAPYVRCGSSEECTNPNADNPNNWESHPSVHYGTPAMNEALQCLAIEWFKRCSKWSSSPPDDMPLAELIQDSSRLVEPQNLVIADISLPGGGLLDIGENWKPIADSAGKCPGGDGHCWHRFGIDADLLRLSVPTDGRCGTRPIKKDDWKKTPLWDKYEEGQKKNMAIKCGLKLYKNDRNHVRLADF